MIHELKMVVVYIPWFFYSSESFLRPIICKLTRISESLILIRNQNYNKQQVKMKF